MTRGAASADVRICGNLVVGVTGAISAGMVPTLLSMLRLNELVSEVHVVMTAAASQFVTPRLLAVASGSRVLTDGEGREGEGQMLASHVDLAKRADLLAVVPTSANTLAKLAHGFAYDLLSQTVLACTCPVVLVPSMNEAMWASAAVQRNVRQCRENGYEVIEPELGFTVATLEPIVGCMPPPGRLISALREVAVRRAEAERGRPRRAARR
jgi:phosphopantothenoylcysteine decarboxylase/phosphopantothenate--cysteine ligase